MDFHRLQHEGSGEGKLEDMIRRARAEDVPVLANLLMRHLSEEGSDLPLRIDAEGAIEFEVANLLDSNLVACFVTTTEGDWPVGMIFAVYCETPAWLEPYGIVFGLYISPEHRGGKKALELIELTRLWFSYMGAKSVIISVRGENEYRAFYERLGFAKVSTNLTMSLEGV